MSAALNTRIASGDNLSEGGADTRNLASDMNFGADGMDLTSPSANGQASTEVTSSSGEDSPHDNSTFKDMLLSLKVERT